jgi:hypothetical protein
MTQDNKREIRQWYEFALQQVAGKLGSVLTFQHFSNYVSAARTARLTVM